MKLIFALLYAATILMPSKKDQSPIIMVNNLTQEQTVAMMKSIQVTENVEVKGIAFTDAKEKPGSSAAYEGNVGSEKTINKYSLPMILVIE